jgi:hypothetical protein
VSKLVLSSLCSYREVLEVDNKSHRILVRWTWESNYLWRVKHVSSLELYFSSAFVLSSQWAQRAPVINSIHVDVCVYIYIYICMYMFFYWLNTHAPLQRSNTKCFIVHLCYYFDIGDAVTRSVSALPLQVSCMYMCVCMYVCVCIFLNIVYCMLHCMSNITCVSPIVTILFTIYRTTIYTSFNFF